MSNLVAITGHASRVASAEASAEPGAALIGWIRQSRLPPADTYLIYIWPAARSLHRLYRYTGPCMRLPAYSSPSPDSTMTMTNTIRITAPAADPNVANVPKPNTSVLALLRFFLPNNPPTTMASADASPTSLLSHRTPPPAPALSYKDLVKQVHAAAPKPYGAIPVPKSLNRKKQRTSDAKTRTQSAGRRTPIRAEDWMNEKSALAAEDDDLKLGVSPPDVVETTMRPHRLSITPPKLVSDTKLTTSPTTPSKSPPTPPNQFMSSFPLYKFSISPPSASSLSIRSFFSTSPPKDTKPKLELSPPTTHLFTFLDDIAPVVVSPNETRSPHTTDSTTSALSDLLRNNYVATHGIETTVPLETFKYSEIPVADADPYGYDSYGDSDMSDDYTRSDDDDDALATSPPDLLYSSSASSAGSSYLSGSSQPVNFKPINRRLPTPHHALRSQQHHYEMPRAKPMPVPALPIEEAQLEDEPSRYVRDIRNNPAHLRMITAEMNMMRARKIVSPLRPRAWLPRRADTFVKGRKSALRVMEIVIEA